MDVTNGSGACARQAGMTLMEQIMVIAIVSLLASVAAPSLHKLLSNSELRTAQWDYIAGLQHARGAAVTSGASIVFCPTLNGRQCTHEAAWERGWLLGRDNDHDDQPDGSPLYVGLSSRGRVRIRSGDGRHQVRFQADGSAYGSNLTLLFCIPGQSDYALSVVVSNAGRIRGATATPAQAVSCAQST